MELCNDFNEILKEVAHPEREWRIWDNILKKYTNIDIFGVLARCMIKRVLTVKQDGILLDEWITECREKQIFYSSPRSSAVFCGTALSRRAIIFA